MRRSRWFVGSLFIMGLLTIARAQSAEQIPAERRLPPGVVGFVSVGDLPGFRRQFQTTLAARMVQDPRFLRWMKYSHHEAEFDILCKSHPIADWVAGSAELNFEALVELCQGEMAVAEINKPKAISWVLFVELGKNAIEPVAGQPLPRWIAPKKAKAGAVKKKAELPQDRIQDFKGTRIHLAGDLVEIDDEAKRMGLEETLMERQAGYFLRDGYLVASGSVTILRAVLERWNGQHPRTFERSPLYKTVREHMANWSRPGSHLRWFVPTSRLRTESDHDESYLLPLSAVHLLHALPDLPLLNPYDGSFVTGGTLEFAGDQFDWKLTALCIPLVATTYDHGLRPSGSWRIPPWIKSGPERYWEWRTKFFEMRQPNLDSYSLSGTEYDFMNTVRWLWDRRLGEREWKLADVLTGTVRLIANPAAGEGEKETLVAFELREAAPNKRIDELFAGIPLHAERVAGRPVWRISYKRPPKELLEQEALEKEKASDEKPKRFDEEPEDKKPKEPIPDVQVEMFATVIHQHLILGRSVQILRQVLESRRDAVPLADQTAIQAASKLLPENCLFRQYRQISTPYLKWATIPDRFAERPTKAALKELYDLDFMRKYLPPVVTAVEDVEAIGIRMTRLQPRK